MPKYCRGDLVYALFPNQEGKGFTDRLTIVLDNNYSIYTLVPCTKELRQKARYKN